MVIGSRSVYASLERANIRSERRKKVRKRCRTELALCGLTGFCPNFNSDGGKVGLAGALKKVSGESGGCSWQDGG